jgi:hypothetical protein
MNISQLKKRLLEADTNMRFVSLDGEVRDECLILERPESGGWCVYYSERGQRTSEKWFIVEDEACDYIFSLVGDNRTFKNRKTGGQAA